jgi:hypothetical protein
MNAEEQAPEWSGDPDDLIGHEDRLLVDADLCDWTFASKHEAFGNGFFLGRRAAAADREPAAAGSRIRHGKRDVREL